MPEDQSGTKPVAGEVPAMSFAEIILTYARHPPLRIAEALRMGRPSRKRGIVSAYLLSAIEDAASPAMSLRDIRFEMKRVLGTWPENLSRPLTVDEMFTLCDTFSLDPSAVLALCKRQIAEKP